MSEIDGGVTQMKVETALGCQDWRERSENTLVSPLMPHMPL